MNKTNSIKVLHLSYYGAQGGFGGAISMRRFHNGLKKSGIDSKVLYIEGIGSNNEFVKIHVSGYKKKIQSYLEKLYWRLGITGLDGVKPSIIKNEKVYINADVINIHRFLKLTPYLGLPSLTRDKPTVITLCDTWAITGRCYNNLKCERWQYGCGHCPHMNVLPLTGRDGSRLEWILKQWGYNRSKLTVVTKCSWMTEMIKQSMLKHFPVYQIPNGIDVQLYKPLDKKTCRSVMQIPSQRKVLMFSAVDMKNFMKGGDLLRQALDYLPASLKSQIIILLMGKNTGKVSNISGIESIQLGYVDSDAFKTIAYSAADLFLCPSRGETLSNVIMESMSCGTPIVAFRVGGNSDFVRPKETGYLAEPWNAKEFSRGIIELLEDESLRKLMGENCRRLITDDFSTEKQADRYLKLYNKLLYPNLS